MIYQTLLLLSLCINAANASSVIRAFGRISNCTCSEPCAKMDSVKVTLTDYSTAYSTAAFTHFGGKFDLQIPSHDASNDHYADGKSLVGMLKVDHGCYRTTSMCIALRKLLNTPYIFDFSTGIEISNEDNKEYILC